MRLLVSSSRMPFALDAIRKLGGRGHQVFACDSYDASPGSHSRYLALDFAVLAQLFQQPLRETPRTIHDLAKVHGTDRGWRDALPKLYSFLALARFERLSLSDRKQLFVAMSDGITWDGQPIPGLPADDAAYLEQLTGNARSA
jgi:hypothetical protein